VLDLLDARGDSSSDPALDEGIVVRTALERLPARDQRLVQLRFGGAMPPAETAESMGLSAMQVSRLLRRTLDELRRQLSAEGMASA
jgi:RNA polymerase sigma-B factor